MKPSWNDAPEWAQWLAQDVSGHWYWYKLEPLPSYGEWSIISRFAPKPQCKIACDMSNPFNPDWQSTLEMRPKTDTKG